jgi:hypothetical protein
MKIDNPKRFYLIFVILGIFGGLISIFSFVGALISIMSFIGISYLGYLDSDKITSAKVVITIVAKTPIFKVQNWGKGGGASGGGSIDVPITFYKGKTITLTLNNGQYGNEFIGESLLATTEVFTQLAFPTRIQMKDVKQSDFITFTLGAQQTYGELEVVSGAVELYMNDTKTVFPVPIQVGVKDINGVIISVPVSK